MYLSDPIIPDLVMQSGSHDLTDPTVKSFVCFDPKRFIRRRALLDVKSDQHVGDVEPVLTNQLAKKFLSMAEFEVHPPSPQNRPYLAVVFFFDFGRLFLLACLW